MERKRLNDTPPKKKPKGHGKGPAFERAMCQRLSLWVSCLRRSDLFWRSAMSGGRATLAAKRKRNRQFSAQVGDISAIHPEGNLLLNLFVVECKFYADLHIARMVFGKKGEVYDFWETTSIVAKQTGREPILFTKQNNQGEIAWTTQSGFNILCLGLDSPEELKIRASFPQIGALVFLVRDIVANVDFARIRQRLECAPSTQQTSTSLQTSQTSTDGASSNGSPLELTRKRLTSSALTGT